MYFSSDKKNITHIQMVTRLSEVCRKSWVAMFFRMKAIGKEMNPLQADTGSCQSLVEGLERMKGVIEKFFDSQAHAEGYENVNIGWLSTKELEKCSKQIEDLRKLLNVDIPYLIAACNAATERNRQISSGVHVSSSVETTSFTKQPDKAKNSNPTGPNFVGPKDGHFMDRGPKGGYR